MAKMLKSLQKNEFLTIGVSLFAFSMALGPFAMSMGLIFFLISAAVHINGWNVTKKEIWFIIGYSMFFLLYLTGIWFTPYTERGLDLLIRTSPLLIVPMAIILSGVPGKVDYFLVRQYFVFGTFLSCIISLGAALVKIALGANLMTVVYYGFAEAISLHPSYYSLYVLTAFIFTIEADKLLIANIKYAVATTFVVVLLFLQSKIVLAFLVLMLLFYMFKFIKKKAYGPTVFLSLLLTLLLLAGVFTKGGRLNELVKTRSTNELGTFDEDGISQRVWLWKTAILHIKEQPLLGFGLGAQEKLFKHKVAKDLLKTDADAAFIKATKATSKLNLHNNYLQIWYEHGLIGLLLFIFGNILVFIKGIRGRKYQAVLIYSIFLFMLFFEVMLNRQMGIYYFALIPVLLFLENSTPNG